MVPPLISDPSVSLLSRFSRARSHSSVMPTTLHYSSIPLCYVFESLDANIYPPIFVCGKVKNFNGQYRVIQKAFAGSVAAEMWHLKSE
jgi:hypothetical protein